MTNTSDDLLKRLEQRRAGVVCPFSRSDHTIGPDEPCPVCGDENDMDAVSNCVESADFLLRMEAAARIRELEAELDACKPYLKPGETPHQRMDRDHADMKSVLKLWAEDKIKLAAMIRAATQEAD